MKVPEPRKLPSGNYNIRLRLNGEFLSITRPTAKECKAEATLLKAEYISKNKAISRDNITLRQAIDNYISAKSNILSPSTIRAYKSMQKNRFQSYADKPADTVNWQKAVNEEAKDVKAKTLYNAWGLVSTALKYAEVDVKSVTLPQKVANEHEWLTPEQIPVFLNAVKGHREELPALLALHGLRRSEIYALTASSFKGNTIHVRGSVVYGDGGLVSKKENKNASSRRDVPILIPRLTELLATKPNFFDVPISGLTDDINKTCEEAKLPKVGTHGLRHSFASLCYHMGLSERQTMQLGGWSDPSTMRKIYTHISKQDMNDAADKLKTFFK